MAKLSSTDRVLAAANRAGLDIEIVEMPASTRTAEEAAAACGCSVAEIVKSLVYLGAESDTVVLLLVSGVNRVDEAAVGRHLGRAFHPVALPTLHMPRVCDRARDRQH